MTHSIEIRRSDDERVRSEVVIDGKDVANILAGLFVDMSPYQRSVVKLSLITPNISITDPRCDIRLPTEERDFLISLGWTPPKDEL
jgi:hypothetical protein